MPPLDAFRLPEMDVQVLERPLLIAGTGPSLAKFDNNARDEFYLLVIHRACRRIHRPHVALFQDWEPWWDVATELDARWVIMNWHLHRNCKRENRSIEEMRDCTLEKIWDKNLLVHRGLNKSHWPKGWNTGVIAHWLATKWGVKDIVTIGIDGGGKHDPICGEKDHPRSFGYSHQFAPLQKLVDEHKLNVRKWEEWYAEFTGNRSGEVSLDTTSGEAPARLRGSAAAREDVGKGAGDARKSSGQRRKRVEHRRVRRSGG